MNAIVWNVRRFLRFQGTIFTRSSTAPLRAALLVSPESGTLEDDNGIGLNIRSNAIRFERTVRRVERDILLVHILGHEFCFSAAAVVEDVKVQV